MSVEVLRFNYPEGMFRFCSLLRGEEPVWIGRNGGSDTDFIELWDGESFEHPLVANMRKLNGYFDKQRRISGLSRFRKMYLDSSRDMDLCTVHMYSRFGSALEGKAESLNILENKYNVKSIMCWRFIENATYFMESFKLWGEGKKILIVSPFSASIEYQIQSSRLPNLHKEDYGFSHATFSTFNTPITYNEDGWFSEDVPQSNWFEVAEDIYDGIKHRDFDIAWLSCGSYAMYLGGKIKNDLGKKAVYIGGLSNVFFNIYNFRYSSTGHDSCIINPDFQIESFENKTFNTESQREKFPFSEGLKAYFGSKE